MKRVHWSLIAIAILLIAVACAGCSSKSGGTGTAAPAGSGAASSSAPAATAAAASGAASCPATTAATSWTGKWVSWGYNDPCMDARVHFYPATTDNPDPWEETYAGVMDFPVTFTQTGCDVTGSITVGPNGTAVATAGCPITLTGTVDSSGAVSGTWHAYCNIEMSAVSSSGQTTDSGIWSLNMEPGGSTFIGTFGASQADTDNYKAGKCSSANSNWVGKRA